MSDHPPAHPTPADRCANCGASLRLEPVPAFCPRCGQETTLHPPTLWEFVHEFITHYVALEGTLWRTLGALLLRPGRLTREYFVGRRRRYVLPLRIYLTASFLFFLLVKGLGLGTQAAITVHAGDPAGGTGSFARAVAADTQLAAWRGCVDEPSRCSIAGRLAGRAIAGLERAEAQPGALPQRILASAPYAVFLLLPLYAGLLALLWRRWRLPYGGHVVFSLHIHAFGFLWLLAASLLPDLLFIPLLLGGFAYAVMALHQVYPGTWWGTLWRAGLLGVAYGAVMLATTLGLVLHALLG